MSRETTTVSDIFPLFQVSHLNKKTMEKKQQQQSESPTSESGQAGQEWAGGASGTRRNGT